jgi:hypothetical protein
MKDFRFWQRWLSVGGILLVVFGLSMALINRSLVFDFLINNQLNPVFWGTGQVGSDISRFQGFVYGVLGATIAGWGIIVYFLAAFPFWDRQRWAWNAIAVSTGLWYLVDTGISIAYGVYFNVAVNSLFLIFFSLPLIFTHRYFSEYQSEG